MDVRLHVLEFVQDVLHLVTQQTVIILVILVVKQLAQEIVIGLVLGDAVAIPDTISSCLVYRWISTYTLIYFQIYGKQKGIVGL